MKKWILPDLPNGLVPHITGPLATSTIAGFYGEVEIAVCVSDQPGIEPMIVARLQWFNSRDASVLGTTAVTRECIYHYDPEYLDGYISLRRGIELREMSVWVDKMIKEVVKNFAEQFND